MIDIINISILTFFFVSRVMYRRSVAPHYTFQVNFQFYFFSKNLIYHPGKAISFKEKNISKPFHISQQLYIVNDNDVIKIGKSSILESLQFWNWKRTCFALHIASSLSHILSDALSDKISEIFLLSRMFSSSFSLLDTLSTENPEIF